MMQSMFKHNAQFGQNAVELLNATLHEIVAEQLLESAWKQLDRLSRTQAIQSACGLVTSERIVRIVDLKAKWFQ
jgi:hypothetical protein